MMVLNLRCRIGGVRAHNVFDAGRSEAQQVVEVLTSPGRWTRIREPPHSKPRTVAVHSCKVTGSATEALSPDNR